MLPNVQRHIVKLILGIDYPTPRIGFVKNPIIDILRARMYAHITGVFCFLLSQVSHHKGISLYFNEIGNYQKQ